MGNDWSKRCEWGEFLDCDCWDTCSIVGRKKRAIVAGEIVRAGPSKNQQLVIMPDGAEVPFLSYLQLLDDEINIDQDEKWTFSEIQGAMDRFKKRTGYEVQIDHKQFDADHSGALSYTEIQPFVRGLLQEFIHLYFIFEVYSINSISFFHTFSLI